MSWCLRLASLAGGLPRIVLTFFCFILQADAVLYDRLPVLGDMARCDSPDAGASRMQLCDAAGALEIGKAFDMANFAVAMPSGAARNVAITHAVNLLKEGAVVYRC